MIKEAVEKLLAVGAASAGVKIELNPSGDPFGIKPDGTIIPLGLYYPPRRISEVVNFIEGGSFTAYVNRFKTDATVIFAEISPLGATFRAILDYHKPKDEAARCLHEAQFSLVATPDWSAWKNKNRVAMSQVEFATWLEDMQHVFMEPSGADLLELVRNLFGRKDAAFNTSVRLDNGAYSVGYNETIEVQSTTTAGVMKLPAQLIAEIPLFEGMASSEIRARLKTRIQDRKLYLFFETIQMDQQVRECIMATVKEVAAKTGIIPYLGDVVG